MLEFFLALCLQYPAWECDEGFTTMNQMPQTYDILIQQAGADRLPDHDWRLLKAQLWQESRLKPNAVSPVGAQGIAQFMPDTWEEWSKKAGYGLEITPFDVEAAIDVSAMYMAYQVESWHWPRPDIDRICLAMASYNAGLGNILDAQRRAGDPSSYSEIIEKLPSVTGDHSAETIDYVKKILFFYDELVTG